jgi:hypothetical protein
MPISHEHRCLFVHIPKTGGTSIENALGMYFRRNRENVDRLFGSIRSSELKQLGLGSGYLQHLTLSEMHTIHPKWPFGDYFSFSFVRNPWDRMVSSFSKKDSHLLREAQNRGIELERLSFEDYVQATGEIAHSHTRAQVEFVTDAEGKVAVDFVGRFESLAEDFQEVCRRAGIHKQLPHKKKSHRNDRDYRRYYDDATRRIIEERYRRDIELFGYEF